jgi:hypothetical protein
MTGPEPGGGCDQTACALRRNRKFACVALRREQLSEHFENLFLCARTNFPQSLDELISAPIVGSSAMR